MENALVIFALVHLFCSFWAGGIGETRTCGFGKTFFAYLLNPVLGAVILLLSKDKADL